MTGDRRSKQAWSKCVRCIPYILSGAPRAKRAPWVSKSSHHRKFGNHVTVRRPQPVRPHHRYTNVYSHTEAQGAHEKTVAHQCCYQLTAVKTRYPLTSITWPYRGFRCRPIQVEYFFKLSADKLLVFKWSQAHFFKFIWNMLCLCHYGPAPLTFWFQTDLGRENSASYLKIQAGRQTLSLFSP